MQKIPLANFVEIDDPSEVTLHARDVARTGSKRLELFASKVGMYKVGDEFMSAGRHYLIEQITQGRPK